MHPDSRTIYRPVTGETIHAITEIVGGLVHRTARTGRLGSKMCKVLESGVHGLGTKSRTSCVEMATSKEQSVR